MQKSQQLVSLIVVLVFAGSLRADAPAGWFAFDPKPDEFKPESGFDLRSLNEQEAGEGGFIQAKGSQFVHGRTGQPVRFWAVNGPPGELKDPQALRQCARMLAKHGVNLVRIHGGYFDESGNVDPQKIQHAIDIVQAMKAEGIYSHFSIYFPLWLRPKADNPWLPGYDGNKNPFSALYFNPKFQKQYQGWWKALLTTPGERSRRKLIDEPAVFGAELINEDSYFFWTFNANAIPDAELRILETQFGQWLKKKYGTLDAALHQWNGLKTDRDNVAEGRMGFRPLWNMFTEKTPRDRDAAAFLLESQRGFYHSQYIFLRGLGFRGVITASNWATASPETLGPLEKYSYTVCDFIDRHGYFGCGATGDGWSLRDGNTYADRSALRFDPEQPGKPKLFANPVMDPSYDGKPSMISETTFNRPNRYRSEAPLYYACYGALQDSDCVVHFALDSAQWSVKPNYFMQPWTLMTPAMMGQFPAAALIYRKGLVGTGDLMANINLRVADIEELKGTPLPQDAAFDELRAKDVPQGNNVKAGQVIDPLIHYVGRTNVNFVDGPGSIKLQDLHPFIDRAHQTVTSSNHKLRLDYGKGTLTINAPAAQGVSGNLRDAGTVHLKDVDVTSDLDLGHIVAVSLDEKPLALSGKILLQVMSEEQASQFRTEPAENGAKRIASIGQDPWLVKNLSGTVAFNRPDAEQLHVTALDFNGYPVREIGSGKQVQLAPDTVYYLVTR